MDCLVENYQYLIPTLKLPDPNDRHILAAALHSKSSVIVTYNLKDFPKEIMSQHDIEAQHPDEFLINLIDLSAETVCFAINRHRTSLKNPTKTKEEYLLSLKKQSLNNSVEKLKEFIDFI